MWYRVVLGVLAGLVLWVLVGCGGGGSSVTNPVDGRVRARLTIQWPDRTRLIPEATESIKVVVTQDGLPIQTPPAVDRPAGEDTSVISLDYLPVGVTLKFTATAYPQPGGQGTVLAVGEQLASGNNGDVIPITIVMYSTITRLVLAPDPLRVPIGMPKEVVASAYDAEDRLVLVAPSDIAWTFGDPTLATLTQNNTKTSAELTGLGFGSTNITATVFPDDSENTISMTALVKVGQIIQRVELSPDPRRVAIGHTSTIVATAFDDEGYEVEFNPSTIVWTLTDASLAAITPNLTAPSAALTGLLVGDTTITATIPTYLGSAVTVTGTALVKVRETVNLDVAFIFDTTGSMGEERTGVEESIQAFADTLTNDDGFMVRVAAVTFGDAVNDPEGDNPADGDPRPVLNFTDDVNAFKNFINEVPVTGGGDEAEVSLDALLYGSNRLDWRDDAYKVAIVITDAPYHTLDDSSGFSSTTPSAVVTALSGKVITYVVSSDYTSAAYTPLAESLGGIWVALPVSGDVDLNTLGILEDIANID